MPHPIRLATLDDIRRALDLALRVFMEFEAPDYPPGAEENWRAQIGAKAVDPDMYLSGRRLLFVALDGDRVVGMAESRETGHIAMLFVDGAYHRRGVATALTNEMVDALKTRGFNEVTVNASPYGLPFYRHFGFRPTGPEQQKDSFIFTPMVYEQTR